jgi:septal ring factor EnvC (AmiA/AmiB activator)
VVNKVKGKLDELSRERTQLNAEKGALQKEKEDLQQQVEELARSVEKLNRDKVVLERELEAEEEQVHRGKGVALPPLHTWQQSMLAAPECCVLLRNTRHGDWSIMSLFG